MCVILTRQFLSVYMSSMFDKDMAVILRGDLAPSPLWGPNRATIYISEKSPFVYEHPCYPKHMSVLFDTEHQYKIKPPLS